MKKENTNTNSFDTYIDFTKFTGKYLCQSLFFNKVAGLRPTTLLKKRLWYTCYPVNFAKFLRTPFLIEHLPWLLLFTDDAIPLRNFKFRTSYRRPLDVQRTSHAHREIYLCEHNFTVNISLKNIVYRNLMNFF